MKNRIVFFICIALPSLLSGQCPDVLPTTDFYMNFCNFPFAWEETRGEDVHIGIVSYENSHRAVWEEKIRKLTPASAIHRYPMPGFLSGSFRDSSIQLVYISEEIKPGDYDAFLAALENYTDVSVILPAYFGHMNEERDYSAWQSFIKKSSDRGAIIAGALGGAYQLGDLSFWEEIPVDVFTLMSLKTNRLDSWRPDYKIVRKLEGSSYQAVGAVALLKSKYPGFSNSRIKQELRKNGKMIYWSVVKLPQEYGGFSVTVPHFDRNSLGKYEDELFTIIRRNVFEGSSLNLMTLFGFNCPDYGGWCFQSLNIEEAQKKATGKGVTVCILDHTFNKNHAVLKNRLIAPVSFIDGVPALSTKSDHGTLMAADLVRVAPDVQIMPVVMAGEAHLGDAELFIKGINYAVENGADIISCSQMAIQGDRKGLDEAIENATKNGLTFVYIHYAGDREEVIVTNPIEFAGYNSSDDIVYVIGTNFFDMDTPFSWGVSHTAPIVSGVIALMKELNPELGPEDIKKILLRSGKKTSDGVLILDANEALKNIL